AAETARTICFLLENVHPSKSVQLPPELLPASVRKNLAVHVSLSSIFTISKSRPRCPSRARTSLEAVASAFFKETGVSVRLPGRSSALSEIVEQWEQQALGVVNVAGC